MNGKAAHMCFVNNHLRPWMPRRLVFIPFEGLVDKYAFWHRTGIVQLRKSQVLLRSRWVISACRRKIPWGQPRNCGSKRVKKKLVEIKTVSFARFVRTIHAIRIELAGADPLHPNVPYVAGTVVRGIQIYHPGGCGIFRMIKQLQPNAAGVPAE